MYSNIIIRVPFFILLSISTLSHGQYTSFKNNLFFDVNVGVTQRISGEKTNSQFHRKVTQTVKNGMLYSVTGYYKTSFLKNTALGLKYMQDRYDGEDNTSLIISGSDSETGKLTNKSQTHFIAISALSSFSFGSKAKNQMYFTPSVGYFYYNQDIQIETKQNISGGNIGFSLDLGYLRTLSNHFSIGLNLGYLNANLENYTIDNGSTKEDIDTNRVDALILSSFHSNIVIRYKL